MSHRGQQQRRRSVRADDDDDMQLSPLTPASAATGNDDVEEPTPPPASSLGGLQQPTLIDDDLEQQLGGGQTHPSQQQHVSLRELKCNPLEDEAENAIVRAIEARERKEKADGYQEPVGAGIFSGVSDAALKIVLEEEGSSDNDSGDGDAENKKSGDDVVHVSHTGASSSIGRSPPSSPMMKRRPSPTESAAASVGSYSSGQSRAHSQLPHHRTPNSSFGGNNNSSKNRGPANFQELANQLKTAQSSRFLAAAAANKSRRDLGLTTGARRSKFDDEEDDNKEDGDSDDGRELCAADAMVRNMNKMLGLPNRHVDVKVDNAVARRRISDGNSFDVSFDIEAQHPIPPGSPPRSSPLQPRKSAAQNWAKVRLAVNASTTMANAAAAAASEAKVDVNADQAPAGLIIEENAGVVAQDAAKQKDDEPVSALRALGRVFAVRGQNILGDISSSINVKFSLKVMLGFLILPSMIVSAILFYAVGNPMPDEPGQLAQSSYSWWILFIGARQVCTLALSKLTEIIVVDVLTLKSRTLLKLFGPLVSLLIIQARGWPYVLTFWGVFNFAFLQGRHSFAKVNFPSGYRFCGSYAWSVIQYSSHSNSTSLSIVSTTPSALALLYQHCLVQRMLRNCGIPGL